MSLTRREKMNNLVEKISQARKRLNKLLREYEALRETSEEEKEWRWKNERIRVEMEEEEEDQR